MARKILFQLQILPLLAILIRDLGFRYSAGFDTTLDTLKIVVLCMVLNPEVQENARQELDRVLGRDRLPSLSDKRNLPYIDRIFYETMRYVDNLLLNVPHTFADQIMT